MSRLIDADALSVNLNGMMAVSPTGYIHGDTIADMIGDAPTIEPEQRWIPCSERLPEKSGLYYVSGGDNVWICEFLIISNFTGGWCNNVANPVVQAWMPLPEPYREEGDDK